MSNYFLKIHRKLLNARKRNDLYIDAKNTEKIFHPKWPRNKIGLLKLKLTRDGGSDFTADEQFLRNEFSENLDETISF